MKNLEATQLVRSALREVGANTSMYTNKYKTMRTVKAYLQDSKRNRMQLTKALQARFGDDAPDFEFTGGYYSWSWSGVIVRLPFDKFEDTPIEVDAEAVARKEERRRLKKIQNIKIRIADHKESMRFHKKSAALKKAAIAELEAELEALG